MDVSVLATRGRKQMNEQNHDTANKLGLLSPCLLRGKQVSLLSALYSHLFFIQFHIFMLNTYSYIFLMFVFLCTSNIFGVILGALFFI